jgi:hypothetical protein
MRKPAILTTLMLLVLSATPITDPSVQPSSSNWEPAGFGGAGAFLSVHFDPRQPGVVYATSNVAGVFRSTDNGDHWQMRSGGLGNYVVFSFAVDPSDPNHLLFSRMDTWHPADAGSGIVESADGGHSWTPFNAGLGHLNVSSLAFGRNSTLFAGTHCGGIWRRSMRVPVKQQFVRVPVSGHPRVVPQASSQEATEGIPYKSPGAAEGG